MKRAGAGIVALALGACGSATADADMNDYRQQAVAMSPVKNDIAASNTFFFCEDHPGERFDILCEACDVGLFDEQAEGDEVVGFKAYATHFFHELKPWEEGGKPKITVTGERGTQKFETGDVSVAGARKIFDEANAWCQERGKGEFLVRKDEIYAYFEGGR